MLFSAKNEFSLLNNSGPHSPNISMIWPIAIVVLGFGANARLVGLVGLAAPAAAARGLKSSARASCGDRALSEADENQNHHPQPARAAKPLSALRV